MPRHLDVPLAATYALLDSSRLEITILPTRNKGADICRHGLIEAFAPEMHQPEPRKTEVTRNISQKLSASSTVHDHDFVRVLSEECVIAQQCGLKFFPITPRNNDRERGGTVVPPVGGVLSPRHNELVPPHKIAKER